MKWNMNLFGGLMKFHTKKESSMNKENFLNSFSLLRLRTFAFFQLLLLSSPLLLSRTASHPIVLSWVISKRKRLLWIWRIIYPYSQIPCSSPYHFESSYFIMHFFDLIMKSLFNSIFFEPLLTAELFHKLWTYSKDYPYSSWDLTLFWNASTS